MIPDSLSVAIIGRVGVTPRYVERGVSRLVMTVEVVNATPRPHQVAMPCGIATQPSSWSPALNPTSPKADDQWWRRPKPERQLTRVQHPVRSPTTANDGPQAKTHVFPYTHKDLLTVVTCLSHQLINQACQGKVPDMGIYRPTGTNAAKRSIVWTFGTAA